MFINFDRMSLSKNLRNASKCNLFGSNNYPKEDDRLLRLQKAINKLKSLITQAIDSGLDELGAQAKQYLNSGNTSKVTCSDWINKLKNAIDKANG